MNPIHSRMNADTGNLTLNTTSQKVLNAWFLEAYQFYIETEEPKE